jgi:dihydroorotate dehydrogenase electron transfer subunit
MKTNRKYQANLTIISSHRLTESYHLLQLQMPTEIDAIPAPGQFVELLIENNPNVFLRRPISVHVYHEKFHSIELLIKIVGKGTQALSHLKAGDEVNTLFFLGNAFDPPSENDKVLLVAAGAGIAPLYFALNSWHKNNHSISLLYATRTKNELVRLEEITSIIQDVEIMTEDGSAGKQGRIIEHPWLTENITQFDRIYACGPDPVLQWLTKKFKNNTHTSVQVSLEHRMACGFGVCLGCVVKTQHGYMRTCVDGPVFNINEFFYE